MQISLISTHHCPGGDLSGMTRLLSVVVHHGYDCLQSDPVMVWRQLLLHHYSRSLPRGTQFFAFPVCVGSVQDIYQVTFLESPGIGTQIILALEPRLRRA